MRYISSSILSLPMISLYLSSLFVLIVLVNVSSLAFASSSLPAFTFSTYKPKENTKGRSTLNFDMDRHIWHDFSVADEDESHRIVHPRLPTENSTGKVCVDGSWLGYAKPNLVASDIKKVTVVSGLNNCIELSKLGINSMQPVSPIRFDPDSIATFKDKYFGSLGNVLAPYTNRFLKIRAEYLPQMNSFIISGNSPMTVVDIVGKIYCITPKSKFKNSICIVPDVNQFGLSYKNPFTAVKKLCDGDKSKYTKSLEVTSCYEFGSIAALTEPKMNQEEQMRDRGQGQGKKQLYGSTKADCPNNLDNEEEPPPNFDVLKQFLEYRVNHDFDAQFQAMWLRNPALVWRTNISDIVFEIVESICPPEILNPLFLVMAREFFTFQVAKLWRQEKVPIKQDVSGIHATMKLQECYRKAQKYSPSMQQGMEQTFKSYRTEKQKWKQLNSGLNINKNYDPIIEIAWASFNLAYGLCHHFHESKVDFYENFVRIVSDLYFNPLASQWLKPQVPPSTFRYLFGGFGFDTQYEGLQQCATSVLKLTRNFEPFGRPTIIVAG